MTSGLTKYANCNIDDIASAFSLFFCDSMLQEFGTFTSVQGNMKRNDWWKQLDIGENYCNSFAQLRVRI